MCGITCCVEIVATAVGSVNLIEGDVKRYIYNKYQVENLSISDVIYYNKENSTHFIITYNTYYEEGVSYCYYDFIKNKREEINLNLLKQFEYLELTVDDLDISIF